ncbi:hypothetical protein JA1_004822 [Spathaspora sp. JA1]|nr:hypothetical protein JA1_004822 [Spathaspora sp. JA1]
MNSPESFVVTLRLSTNRRELNFLSLPEEIIFEILTYLNQFDAMNIRLLNRNLNQIGSIKLFRSIFVYLPELTAVTVGLFKSKIRYGPFFINYTSVSGHNNFKKVLNMKQLSLVKNVVLYIHNPNKDSYYCYSSLIQRCPWITVDVDSSCNNMFKNQISRLDKISQLRIRDDFLFTNDINDNYSIRELYISGSRKKRADPIVLIPKLKGLILLYIDNPLENDLLGHFKECKISGLKLKKLGLRVPVLALKKLNEVFVLDDIVTFELHFYGKSKPYVGLRRLCSQMNKLGSIHISWCNVSFEKVMQQLLGLRLYQIKLESHGQQEKEITGPEIEQLLRGHDSLISFGISIGPISYGRLED